MGDVRSHLRQAKDQAQDQENEEKALPGMENDGEPGSAVAFGGEGVHQTGQDTAWDAPGLVEMIEPKEDGVRDPIPSPEDAFHLGQQGTAEDEFLAQEGVEQR